MIRALVTAALAVLLSSCVRVHVYGDPRAGAMADAPTVVRIATYNTSLNDDAPGGLLARLQSGDGTAHRIAAVLQRVRPDIVLLNEFDFDDAHAAADVFQRGYLQRAQPDGGDALTYPYRYLAPVNTGVPSGLDLDGNGSAVGTGRDRGNDAWGYGLHPGQYGMLLLSRYPIDAAAARTFRLLKWSAMPDAARPSDPHTGKPFHADAVWSQLRLSSKSHWDVPLRTPLGVVHVLASHPTPPVFDGAEDRNGARNADEIRFWREYLSSRDSSWLCDDRGRCGGLAADARFVILGDMNNDPVDGDGRHEAITTLLQHQRLLRGTPPQSRGGADTTAAYAKRGIAHRASPSRVTGDFGPRVGTLRLDYVLPSTGFDIRDSGVFWPVAGEPGHDLVDATDHRLLWIDLGVAQTAP